MSKTGAAPRLQMADLLAKIVIRYRQFIHDPTRNRRLHSIRQQRNDSLVLQYEVGRLVQQFACVYAKRAGSQRGAQMKVLRRLIREGLARKNDLWRVNDALRLYELCTSSEVQKFAAEGMSIDACLSSKRRGEARTKSTGRAQTKKEAGNLPLFDNLEPVEQRQVPVKTAKKLVAIVGDCGYLSDADGNPTLFESVDAVISAAADRLKLGESLHLLQSDAMITAAGVLKLDFTPH